MLAPLELNKRPKHLIMFVRRIGHPQVDSLQKLTLLASPIVSIGFSREPELSDGFRTGTHHFC